MTGCLLLLVVATFSAFGEQLRVRLVSVESTFMQVKLQCLVTLGTMHKLCCLLTFANCFFICTLCPKKTSTFYFSITLSKIYRRFLGHSVYLSKWLYLGKTVQEKALTMLSGLLVCGYDSFIASAFCSTDMKCCWT